MPMMTSIYCLCDPDSGINPSPETRRILSLSRLGKINSPETRKKISEATKGKHHFRHTEKAREKIAAFRRGRPLSTETKKKISEARIKYYERRANEAQYHNPLM